MRRWILLGVLVVLAFVPFLVQSDPYWLSLLSKLFINAMFGLSMWPLFTIGRLTMAHAGFYGLGAYGVSVLMLKGHMNFWLALPAALLGVAIMAYLIGKPTLRLRGATFAMCTFAFSEVIRLLYLRFDNPFGGAQGLFGIPSASPINLPLLPQIAFTSFISQYYLMFGALLLIIAVYYRLVHSYLGLVLRSIRDANQLSSALAVNVGRIEMATFIITGVGAAFAGALYAVWAHYLEPNLFTFLKTLDAQAYVIVGGQGFALGPLLGAAFMTLLPEYLNLAREASPIVTGTTLIVIMLLLRGGFISLPAQIPIWGRSVSRLVRTITGSGQVKKPQPAPAEEV